jgi:hypothetical protein
VGLSALFLSVYLGSVTFTGTEGGEVGENMELVKLLS